MLRPNKRLKLLGPLMSKVPLSLVAWAATIALLPLVIVCAMPQDDQHSEQCYALQTGSWTPPIRPSGDSIFHQPPKWFGLLPSLREDSSRHELRPAVALTGITRIPIVQKGWWVRLPGGLEIGWADGFTGVSVLFNQQRGDTLTGTAKLHTDEGDASYAHATAWARASAIKCPAAQILEDVRRPGA